MNTEVIDQAQADQPPTETLPPLSLNLDQIDADLYAAPAPAPEKAPAPESKTEPEAKIPETTETPKTEPPKEETPKAETTTDDPPKTEEPDKLPTEDAPKEDEPKSSTRVRISDVSPLEVEAIELRRRLKSQGEEVPSLKDAIEIVEVLRAKTKPAPSPTAAVIEQREALETEHTTAETELAEVTAKLDELAEAESPVTKDFLALQDRKNALSRSLEKIEGRQLDRIKSVRSESRAAAIEIYPSAADRTTALGRQIDLDVAEMTANPQHPDRYLLSAERAPEAITEYSANKIARQIAKEQNISVAAAKQTLMAKTEVKTPAKETPAPSTTQTKKVAPVSGAASTKTEAPKAEPWNAADPKTFTPEAYDDLYPKTKGLIFRL